MKEEFDTITEIKCTTGLENSMLLEKTRTLGKRMSIYDPLVEREKIFFPRLNINLGLMQQSVKAIDINRSCFTVE